MRKAGQIALFKFPQTDFFNGKLRPALLIAKLPGDYEDWLVCMISSQVHQYIKDVDDIISPDSDDFLQSGLKTQSVFRVSRLAVAAEGIIIGTIGTISQERLNRIKNNLITWIKSSA
ncbi:MAG: type II toxin-antitoxin system PemK/MazF family toxin [candidate division KSB1 bacterium]|nr:type II toxin-antitoxin system PemK/MazF family toxin [candidate division KSB1 bacterium]MDZ7313932.1 type II toxin-antitoxin system PemK/MazF family toxin [candidate division KSB1 bacterium]